MELKHTHLKELFFFFLLIALAAISFFIFKPFLGIIVISIVLVEIFSPIYYFLLKKIKNVDIAATLSTLFVIIVVIIPMIFILLIATNQALSLKDSLQAYITDNHLLENNGAELTNRINDFLASLRINFEFEAVDYKGAILNLAGSIVGSASTVVGFLKDIVNVIIAATFLIYTLIYIFKEHGNLRSTFKKFSPLDNELDNLFIEKFNAISTSVVKGTLVVGAVQGIAGGIMFWILGINAPLFWTLVMIFLSTVPLGSGFVWIPASIILLVSGQPVKAIILFLWGILVISSIDNFLRPKLLEKDAKLHPLVSFFSVLGGIRLFGILGIIYGPLMVILFLALYEAYRHKNKKSL